MGTFLTMVKFILGMGPSDPSANLTPQEAHQRLNGKQPPQLVDVRTPDENRQGRIAGSRLIPLQELGNRLGEMDKNKPLIVYCRSGNRSGMALGMLKSNGFADAAQIAGGLMAWSRCGLPVETK